jgi:hypothetical protein
VVHRLQAFVKQKHRPGMGFTLTMIDTEYGDELTAGVSFLQRFDDPRIEAFFVWLRAQWSSLFEREQRFLVASVPGFGGGVC